VNVYRSSFQMGKNVVKLFQESTEERPRTKGKEKNGGNTRKSSLPRPKARTLALIRRKRVARDRRIRREMKKKGVADCKKKKKLKSSERRPKGETGL